MRPRSFVVLVESSSAACPHALMPSCPHALSRHSFSYLDELAASKKAVRHRTASAVTLFCFVLFCFIFQSPEILTSSPFQAWRSLDAADAGRGRAHPAPAGEARGLAVCLFESCRDDFEHPHAARPSGLRDHEVRWCLVFVVSSVAASCTLLLLETQRARLHLFRLVGLRVNCSRILL
jgi:hypothetical protein